MFTLSLHWLVLALDTSLKAALLAILAALALRCLSLRDSNVRHRVWTGVLLGMLLLPLLARTIPALRLPLPLNLDRLLALQIDEPFSPPAADASSPSTVPEFDPQDIPDTTPADPTESTTRPRLPRTPFSRRPNSSEIALENSPAEMSSEPTRAAEPSLESSPPTPAAAHSRSRPVALLVIAAVAAVWFLGTTILLLGLLLGLVIALRLVRISTIINHGGIAPARECSLIRAPLTVGLFRPQILLPPAWRSWSPQQLSAVLAHERMHIERGDCLILFMAQINRCLYWFHPLAWWLPQRLASLAEAACDDAVIGVTGDRTAYARHLLDVAASASFGGGRLAPLGVSMARHCEVETRIHAILDFRRPLAQRLTWTRALLLLACMFPLIALAAALQPSPATPAQNASDGNVSDDSSASPTAADKNLTAPLRVRVLSARGKPVAGAKVYWFDSRIPDLNPSKPRLIATTTASGEFTFTRTVDATPQPERLAWTARDYLVVIAPGHGFAYEYPEQLARQSHTHSGFFRNLISPLTGKPGPTIKLPAAGETIRGRLVNIEGQPVAGATIKTRWFEDIDRSDRHQGVAKPSDTDTAAWRERVSDLLATIEALQFREVMPTAKTDADGRFELANLGANRLVQLLVQSESTETVDLAVRNQSGQPVHLDPDNLHIHDKIVLHPREFTAVLGPSKPLTGRVLDLDTNQPIADAVVRAYQLHGHRISGSDEREEFATRTNAHGRYRLTGLPVGNENTLVAFTTGDIPYFPAGHQIDTSKGDNIQQDFRLKRGIWATGRVFDAETNAPFTGEIEYYLFRNHDLEKQTPGLFHAWVDELYWTDNDGQFRVPVLPTRGILAFRSTARITDRDPLARFPRGSGMETIQGAENIGSLQVFPTLPHYLTPINYHRVAEVYPRPAPSEKTAEQTTEQSEIRVDMPLHGSAPFRVHVVDASGQPVPGCEIYGATQQWGWQNEEAAEFAVTDLVPGQRRKLFAFHRARGLAGAIIVTHKDSQPAEIQLAAAGSLSGRVRDKDSQPIAEGMLLPDLERLADEDRAAIWADDPKLHYNPSNIPLDKDGRFHLTGIIPGWTYTAHVSTDRKLDGAMRKFIIGQPFQNVTIEPGQHKDLGDLVVREGESREGDTIREGEAPAEPNPKSKIQNPKSESAASPPSAPESPYTYSGTVLDPAGKPIAGAKLHLCYYTREATTDITPLAITAADGTFRFSRHRQDFDQLAEDGQPWRVAVIVATAEGFGFAAAPSVVFETTGRLNAELPAEWRKALDEKSELRLVADAPIRGRIVNVDGQPVAGAKLTLLEISAPQDDGTLDDWEKAAVQPKANTYELQRLLDFLINGPRAAIAANISPSDSDGWLTIRGLGKDRLAKVQLRSASVEAANFFVRTRPGQTFKLFSEPNERMGEETYYPSTFTHIAGPSQPVIGQITDAETGQPIPGCLIEGRLSLISAGGAQVSAIGEIQAAADAVGRYRLEGLQQTAKYPPFLKNVQILPPHGTPYLPSAAQVKIGLANEAVTHDVKLRRGVVVRGQALDARTGQPVLGSVHYRAFPDNPATKAAPDFGAAHIDDFHYQTDSEGRYEIPVLPGKGVVSFSAMDHRDYPHGVGYDEVQAAAGPNANQNFPLISLRHHQALKVVDLAADAKEANVDFLLHSAGTLTGRVLSTDGQLLKKYLVYGATPQGGWDEHLVESFEVKVYEPSQGRRLIIAEPEQNLFAIHQLAGAVADTFDIKLAPAAIIKGRIIDADGQPLENITITNPGIPLSSPAMMGPPKPGPSDRGVIPSHIEPRRYQTDKNGRFELRGLIPGLKYTADCQGPGKLGNSTIITFLGRLFTDVVTQPGQTLDLGDLKIQKDDASGNQKQAAASPIRSASEEPTLARSASDGNTAATPQKPAPQPPAATDSADTSFTCTGIIVDPAGKPISGVKVFIPMATNKARRMLGDEVLSKKGQTDQSGRFAVSIASTEWTDRSRPLPLIAAQPGYGVEWFEVEDKSTADSLRIVLRPEQPISGRLINGEGRPVAGAKVSVRALMMAKSGDSLDAFLNAWKQDIGLAPWYATKRIHATFDSLLGATSDADGRFVISGVASEGICQLEFTATNHVIPPLWIVNREGFNAAGFSKEPSSNKGAGAHMQLAENKFTQVCLPDFKLVGRVTAEGGQPVAGAQVWANSGYNTSVTAETDADGRYRLAGLGRNHRLGVSFDIPGKDEFLARQMIVTAQTDESEKTLDVELKRGIVVSGRITDPTTGNGAGGYLKFVPLGDNEFLKQPGYEYDSGGSGTAGGDGTFELTVMPGPGVIMLQIQHGQVEIGGEKRVIYRQARFSPEDSQKVKVTDDGEDRFFTTVSNRIEFLMLQHAAKYVNFAPGSPPQPLNLQVDRGQSVDLEFIDDSGRPVPNVFISGITDSWPMTAQLSEPRCTVYALGADRPRHVMLLQKERGLAASLTLSGDEPSPVRVTLKGSPSLRGRAVDEVGEPLVAAELQLNFLHRSANELYRFHNLKDAKLVTDKDGRFEIQNIVPDQRFNIDTKLDGKYLRAKLAKNQQTLDAGHQLDLGRVVFAPPNGMSPAAKANDPPQPSPSKTAGSVQSKNSKSNPAKPNPGDTTLPPPQK